MGIKYPILQIVGYQNSGKTTLVEKIVQKGTADGIKVATIKHHGHKSNLETFLPTKDSGRHRKAGSVVTAVEGGGMLQLEATTTDWSLTKLLQLYTLFEHDMILVEGYKNEAYPKIVLIRNQEDIQLLSSLSNIIAVISWIPLKCNYQLFDIRDESNYLNWLFRS